jgi:outer membrane protein TolC
LTRDSSGDLKKVLFAARLSRPLIFALPLAFLTAEARAQRPLALEEALSLAREKNRDLIAARATLAASDAGVEQAWAGLLPIVTAQGTYTHNNKEVTLDLAAQNQALLSLSEVLKQNATSNDVMVALQQFQDQLQAQTSGPPPVIQNQEQLDGILAANVPLIAPAAWASLSAARRQREASDANYESTVASVLVRVAQSFYAAAGADELLKVRKHAIEVAKETLANAEVRLQSGMVNRVEVTRAALAVLRAEQQEVEAADVRDQNYRALKTILALEEEITVTPPADAKSAEQTPVEQLAAEARTRRPELAALERTIAAFDAQSTAALWRWSPTISAFGNARAFNYAGFSGDKYAWGVGLQLDWMIYDGGARDAQRHLAQAQKSENEARLAQLEDTVTDEIVNAQRAVATRRRALDTAVRSVELSKETLELVRAQHEAGTVTQIDVLQAQDALIAAEVAVAQARFDLQLAHITLERASGAFPGVK